MNKMNIPKENRYALVVSDMYDQLLTDATFTSTRDTIKDADLPNGVINRVYGFDILERSTVLKANNATLPVVKTPDAATATTDNGVVLCWQKDTVARAMGTIKPFQNIGDPQYYGDIYSFLVRMGGRKRRADGAGVIGIVQDAA